MGEAATANEVGQVHPVKALIIQKIARLCLDRHAHVLFEVKDSCSVPKSPCLWAELEGVRKRIQVGKTQPHTSISVRR